MTIEQHRRLAWRLQPVRVDDRVSGRVDDLDILQPDPVVLLGEVASGTTDVIGVFRLAGDARDAQKILELAEALFVRFVEEFVGRSHRRLI